MVGRYYLTVLPESNYAKIPDVKNASPTISSLARSRVKAKTSDPLSVFGFDNDIFLRKDARENAAFPEGKHGFEDEEFANVVPPIRSGDACLIDLRNMRKGIKL